MDAATEVRALGNIATREQLIARGLTGFDLTAAVRRGQIRRVRRAHYATPEASRDAVVATRVGGRLAGTSAARSFGLWGGFDERVHIAVPANAGRLRTNLAPRYSDRLSADISAREIVLHWLKRPMDSVECWRVELAECLRQVVAWSDRETAVATLDCARTVFTWDDAEVARLFSDESPRARVIASRSCSGSGSGAESVVRQRLLAVGIAVNQQVAIPGVGSVDMVVRGTKVIIEVDGYAYHSDARAFENDRRRDAELAARGYVVVRLSFARVFGDWVWCEAMVRAALTQFRSR